MILPLLANGSFAFSDADRSILERSSMVDYLVASSPQDETAAKKLAAFLSDSHRGIRLKALAGLAEFGEAGLPFLGEIEDCLNDNDEIVVLYAQYAKAKLLITSTTVPVILDPLIKGLQSEKPKIRKIAAERVGDLAPQAAELIPFLCNLLKDRDYYVAINSASALGNFGALAKGALPELEALLNRPKPNEAIDDPARWNQLLVAVAIATIKGATQ